MNESANRGTGNFRDEFVRGTVEENNRILALLPIVLSSQTSLREKQMAEPTRT